MSMATPMASTCTFVHYNGLTQNDNFTIKCLYTIVKIRWDHNIGSLGTNIIKEVLCKNYKGSVK